MCLNCGCGEPNERHGKKSNITARDVEKAALANHQDVAMTVGNIKAGLSGMSNPVRLARGRAASGRSAPRSAMGDTLPTR